MKDIKLIFMDDWTALYIDGKLALENNRVNTTDILKAIGVEFQAAYIDYETEMPEPLPADYAELEKFITLDNWN